jgi:hypothetical protein
LLKRSSSSSASHIPIAEFESVTQQSNQTVSSADRVRCTPIAEQGVEVSSTVNKLDGVVEVAREHRSNNLGPQNNPIQRDRVESSLFNNAPTEQISKMLPSTYEVKRQGSGPRKQRQSRGNLKMIHLSQLFITHNGQLRLKTAVRCDARTTHTARII